MNILTSKIISYFQESFPYSHLITKFRTSCSQRAYQPISCRCALSIPPQNIRKPEVFWCSQWGQKETSGIKWDKIAALWNLVNINRLCFWTVNAGWASCPDQFLKKLTFSRNGSGPWIGGNPWFSIYNFKNTFIFVQFSWFCSTSPDLLETQNSCLLKKKTEGSSFMSIFYV